MKIRTSTVCTSKIDPLPRHMLIIKNPQFSPNFDDTLPKWSSHGMVILTKCHKNWVKIVDFLLIAYFWAGGQFCLYILYLLMFLFFLKKHWKLIIISVILTNLKSRTFTLHFNICELNFTYIMVTLVKT